MISKLQRLVDAYFAHVAKFGEPSAMKILSVYGAGACCDIPADKLDEAITEMERGTK